MKTKITLTLIVETSFQQISLPCIISPNLGVPAIIESNFDSSLQEWHYMLEINIIAAKNHSNVDIYESLENNVFLRPLFDLDTETKRLCRGNMIPVEITKVDKKPALSIYGHSLKDLYSFEQNSKGAVQSYLLRHKFFGDQCRIFRVQAHFSLKEHHKTQDWLHDHRWLMFDLYHLDANFDYDPRICYHSVVILNDNFPSVQCIQITDLHLANRYDNILSMLQQKPLLNQIEERLIQKKIPPIDKRYKNPNEIFRQFILWANEQKKHGSLDIIFITGDIIDYFLKTTNKKAYSYKLEESNWELFLQIVLNLDDLRSIQKKKNKVVIQEELVVPFFTCTGNHDVHVYGYPLHTLHRYHLFGLNQIEALAYRDPIKLRKSSAITIDKNCLSPYYQYINPFDDYFVTIKNKLFVFLNSGRDEFLDLRSLLMVDPSSIGFSDHQYNFITNVLSLFSFLKQPVLFSHAPIVNPVIKNTLFRILLYKLRIKKWIYESIPSGQLHHLLGMNKVLSPRIFRFDHGTIHRNWEKFIWLLYNHQMIQLCGHGHRIREIEILFDDREASILNQERTALTHPFHFSCDDLEFVNPKLNPPPKSAFVIHTPALGIGRNFTNERAGAFRIFEYTSTQIIRMQIGFIDDSSIMNLLIKDQSPIKGEDIRIRNNRLFVQI